MKLQELLNVLIVYRSNFQNLHWNSVGENFDNAHKEISSDYYEKVSGTIDTIAEMCCRLNIMPLNYKEVFDAISGYDAQYLVVESQHLYGRTEIVQMSDIMLKDITRLLAETITSEEMQTPINAGMRSELETILNEYDIQARFINSRKLMPEPEAMTAAPAPAEEEPEVDVAVVATSEEE